ncbi:MAG: non-canonical purine NTP pyrophosphatase [Chloroflexi bacterium]|nr:non-canonical purine NTP pyrophosphatase [Chloroflexota bacterium]
MPFLLVGTTSLGKIRELRALLAGVPARVVVPGDLGIDLDVAEGDDSFAENAVLKARAYQHASGILTLAEDSGFEVDALGGEPGVRSARWGNTDDYEIKNRLILERLTGVPPERRGCRYVCVLAVATPDGRVYRQSGACEGQVADEPRGDGGFGYDPIFFVPHLGQTMAEISLVEKDRISHRGRAVRAALPLLRALLAGQSPPSG